MVVSQFSLQARKEAILRKSPFEFLNANRGLLTWSLSVLRFGSRMMGQKRRALFYGSIVTIVVLHTSQPSTYHRYLPFLVMFFIPSYIKNCQKSTFRHGVWFVINFLVSLCALSLGQARRVPMPNAQCPMSIINCQ